MYFKKVLVSRKIFNWGWLMCYTEFIVVSMLAFCAYYKSMSQVMAESKREKLKGHIKLFDLPLLLIHTVWDCYYFNFNF